MVTVIVLDKGKGSSPKFCMVAEVAAASSLIGLSKMSVRQVLYRANPK